MSEWTTRQKVGAIVGIAVHAAIVWHVWEMSKMTPRNVQFINCDGEIEFEGHYRPGETPPPQKKETPREFSI